MKEAQRCGTSAQQAATRWTEDVDARQRDETELQTINNNVTKCFHVHITHRQTDRQTDRHTDRQTDSS